MRFGIVRKIFLGLLLVTLVLIGAIGYSFDRFNRVQRHIQVVAEREVPGLVAVAELEQATTRLAAMPQEILLPRSQQLFRSVREGIEVPLEDALTKAAALANDARVSVQATNIGNRFRAIAENLRNLIELRQTAIELEKRHERIYRRLAEILAVLNAEDKTAPEWNGASVKNPYDEVKRTLSRGAAQLFAIREAMHPDLILANREPFDQVMDFASGDLSQELRLIKAEILNFGAGERSLFDERAKLVRLGGEIESTLYDSKYILDLLMEESDRLHDGVRSRASAAQQQVQSEVLGFRRTLVGMAVVCLAAMGGILLFVRASVVRRIVSLQREVKERAQNDLRPVEVVGDDELSEMVREFNYFIDIIHHREQQLRETAIKAEEANRAKSEFIANISHEIRTPMNSILNLTTLAMEEATNPRQREWLVKVGRSARYLLELINEILDFSRIESRRMALESVPFRLANLLDSLDIHAEDASRKGLSFVQRLDKGAPPVVLGDPLRIQQILCNLVGNAVKFTESGAIEVNIRRLREEGGVHWIEFAVEDSGVGIDDSKLGQIFDPFHQADSSTTRQFGGSGLGLTICKRLTEAMGGVIEAASRIGEGSRFQFTLPLHAADESDLRLHGAKGDAEVTPRLGALRGQLVLVVEDNEFNQTVTIQLLERVGAHSDLAINGREAVELAGDEHYDLILMDIQMPEMDGYGATQEIRRIPGYAEVPILALTASAMAETRERCLEVGMNDMVAKPIDPAELYAAMLRWIPDDEEQRSFEEELLSGDDSDERMAAQMQAPVDEYGLAELFVLHYKDVVTHISSAVNDKDTETVLLGAHNLKAAARSVHAHRLATLAAELERGLRDQPNQMPTPDQLHALQRELDDTLMRIAD